MPRRRISLPAFAKRLANLNGDLREAVIRGLQSAAIRLEGLVVTEIDRAKPFPAVDRGELRNSVVTSQIGDGARVEVTAPHASTIEHGARPFFPPLQPLIDWALRKGIAEDEDDAEDIAFLIARQFAVTGIEPRHYFRKATARLQRDKIIQQEISRELDKLGAWAA